MDSTAGAMMAGPTDRTDAGEFIDLAHLDHDTNEDGESAATPIGVVMTPPEEPAPGPIGQQRLQMREVVNIPPGEEWLRLDNPAVWDGDVDDDDDVIALL